MLDRMPLTENGKIDRKALRAPASARAHASPVTDTERRLVALMSEMLGVETVSTQTNLFELGFTSLQMVKLAQRLQEDLGRPVPVVELFRLPTLAALAAYLSDAGAASGAVEAAAADERSGKRRALMAARDRRRGDKSES